MGNLHHLYIDRIRALFAVPYLIAHLIMLGDLIDQSRNVHKYLVTTIVRRDESKTLGLIEKFYCSFLHCIVNKFDCAR